jgi:DNA-binding transcriptional LysR family regulator
MLDDIHAIGGGNRGEVSISAPFTTCVHLLPPVLKCFTSRFPNVRVTVLDQPQDAAVALVREGEVDFAIASEGVVPRALHVISWKRVAPVLMVPLGHPLASRRQITIEEIAEQKLIAPPANRRHPGRLLLERLGREAGLTLHVAIESGNVELSSRLVEQGLGVSFATIVEGASFPEGRSLEFLPIDHLLSHGKLVIAMRDKDAVRGVRARFLDTLRES